MKVPVRKMFHTQEKRGYELIGPILCTAADAWLGDGYYFWYSEDDAVFWGYEKKCYRAKYFEIYSAQVNGENVLDTVFNEEEYKFWVSNIETARKKFFKAGQKLTLKELNDYFKQKNIWTRFDGILFQDISKNNKHYFVPQFQYVKRIQMAVYNEKIIGNFTLHYTGQCV